MQTSYYKFPSKFQFYISNSVFYLTLTHQANVPPALNDPGLGSRQLHPIPTVQSLLALFKPVSPNLFTFSSLAFLAKTSIKAVAHAFPSLLLLLPDPTWCFPMWPCMEYVPLLLETLNNKKRLSMPLSSPCSHSVISLNPADTID